MSKEPSPIAARAPDTWKKDQLFRDKVSHVMSEFASGRLKSPEGKVINDREQAEAIAMSEARKHVQEHMKRAKSGKPSYRVHVE